MSTPALSFQFEDVLPTIQRAHTQANRDDAEDALSTAITEGLEKGWALSPANLVRCARFRLLNAMQRRERRNLSLDAFLEDSEDTPPVELAVEEVDFDSHVALAEATKNPVLRRRLEATEVGGAPVIQTRGGAHPAARYSDATVQEARRLRRSGLSYAKIAKAVGATEPTVHAWIRGQSRRTPSTCGWDRDLVVEAIQAFQREEDRRPNFDDLKHDPRLPSLRVVERLFGRWGAALDAAGLQWRNESSAPKWTHERVLAAFRAFFDRTGHRPTTREFRAASNGLPAYGVLKRLFRTTSLTKVCDLAGLPA